MMFALVAPLAGAAQDDPDADSVAAEGTGVARISLIDGDVAVQRGDADESLAVVRNTPVLGGDYVTTGDASRAEIELDGFSQVRLDADAQLRFTHLDTDNRSMQLAAGTLDLRLTNGAGGSSEIDTPSIGIAPQQSGSYRVTVTPDGATRVTVRSGEATIVTPQSRQDLLPGSTVVASGDPANPAIRIEAAVAFDDFDRFNHDRDRALAAARADAAYVNPRIGGLEELAADGRWVADGSYGTVWVPAAVGPDWAPYRNGRWVWEDGYGWTWLAAEPWGWAPYHYGSWYDSPAYGWCWYPPQPHIVVPWRPALVAFIGFGAGAGFSIGFSGGASFANIGWVPLAPAEPYHPWWGSRYGGPTVGNVTTVTNITNVNVTNVNVYQNARSNGVSSVSAQRFLQGNFSRNAAVTPAQLAAAHVFQAAVPVVPTASNLRFTPAGAAPAVTVRPRLHAGAFAGPAAVVRRTPFVVQRVALATAAHTAITPLHFKDARTTPVVPAQSSFGRMPEHGTTMPPAASAQRRFTTSRPPDAATLNAGQSGDGRAPATIDERARPGATLERPAANGGVRFRQAGSNAELEPRPDRYRAPYPAAVQPRPGKADAAQPAALAAEHAVHEAKPHAKPAKPEAHRP